VDWKSEIQDIYRRNSSEIRSEPIFREPITEQQIVGVKEILGVELSGDLLDLLKQTNGFDQRCFSGEHTWKDFALFGYDQMIKFNKSHLEFAVFLKEINQEPPCQMFFFTHDGYGNGFGFKVENGKLSNEVGVYEPIDNWFLIKASNFKAWLNGWFSGEIHT